MKYMIELQNVPSEIYFYIAEMKDFGEVVMHPESLPTFVWLESEWEKDILEGLYGVKKVYEPKYKKAEGSVVE